MPRTAPATTGNPMTVVVGVDGSGRTHRLDEITDRSRTVRVAGTTATAAEVEAWLAEARDAGHLVVVDDAHRLDAVALRTLTAAARQGVAMAISRRPTIDRPELAALDEAVAGGGTVEHLGPLGPDDVAQMLRAGGRGAGPDTVTAVLRASAGLAWVAAALVSALPTGPPPGSRPPPAPPPAAGSAAARPASRPAGPATRPSAGPPGVSALGPPPAALVARVHRRVALLDAGAAALARVLALRLDLADEVLVAAAGLTAPVLAAAMRTLRDEGLLVMDGEGMIPAVAAAILADLPPAERRRAYETVADALLASGADPVVAATQLRAARARTARAAEVYRAAGDHLRFTDPTAAVQWFDDAVDAGADPHAVAAGRAEAAALLGMPVDLDEAAPESTTDRVRLALVDGAVAAHAGRAARAAEALLAAGAVGRVLAVPALIATGEPDAARRAASPAAAPEPTGAAPTAAAPTAAAPTAGEPTRAEATGAASTGAAPTAATGSAAAGVERAPTSAAGPGGKVPASLHRFAEAALAATDPAAALPLLIEAAEAAERVPPTVVLPDTPHALGALIAVTAGDAASAEYLLERAITAEVGGPVAIDRHRLLLAWVHLRTGRYDTPLAEAKRLAGAALPGRERLLLAAVTAGIARRSGDIARIRETWAGAEQALARRAVDLFQTEPLEELAVAAARLRQHQRIVPVLDMLDGIVERLGRPPAWLVAAGWIRLQLAVAGEDAIAATAAAERIAAADPPGHRQQALVAAARLWASTLAGQVDQQAVHAIADQLVAGELPWEASRLVGQAAIRTTDPSAARRLLERARELSTPDAATPHGEAPARTDPRLAGLSEREIEVARLVLAGRTHRDIGAQLYISPKTVEHHVARIRTKLGATTRAEFVAAVREVLDDEARRGA